MIRGGSLLYQRAPPPLLLGQWRKKCHQSARNNPSASVSTDLSRTAHCHSLWGQSVPGSYGRIRRNPRYYHERTLNLADIIASGDIDRSVVPPPSSSHPLGAACVCSQWHLITELTKARGGPSGVNEIVTGHRRGTSVRDNAERGAIQRTLPAAALGFIQPFFFFFSSSTGSSAAVFYLRPELPVSVDTIASDSFAASALLEMSKKRPAEPESRVKQQASLGSMTRLPCFSPESVE